VTTSELISLITYVVTKAGGQVTKVERTGEKIRIELDGLPDGPLTDRQYRAILALLEFGIDCMMGK
jgi:hypothetical protein